jgi:hypothetical protein
MLLPTVAQAFAHCPNIGYWDDITTRVDKIASFNKYLVTDESVGAFQGGGYICPTSGRYKLRVKSYYKKELVPDQPTEFDGFGNGVADFGWDDNVLVMVRRNESGDFVFSYDGQVPLTGDDFRDKVLQWMGQADDSVTDRPSDIIAYASPKRIAALGASNLDSTGSPLSNFTETVNVLASSHTIISNTTLLKSSESSAEIEIEIDLEKNERVNFYWVSVINTYGPSLNSIVSSNTELNDADSEIEIEYLCGFNDIDIASNLPETSCKEFISSFINQFNLRFNVEDGSKTVEFILPNTFYTNSNQAYEIDSRVEFDSVSILPPDAPSTLIVGYDNDGGDRLLTVDVNSCDFTNTTEIDNYANYVIKSNDNIYADGELEIKTLFSATRFVTGSLELMDIAAVSQTIGSVTNPHPDCNGYPTTMTAYWRFDGGTSLTYELPSIQSRSSFDQDSVGELEYSYNYAPRVLYFLGTANQVFGTDADYKIKIDSRGPVLGAEDFAIQPTVCSFDTENSNPYPSLRYDTYLYNEYFENLMEYYNTSYILEAQIALRGSDWRALQPNVLVRFRGVVYRLLEISSFDPLEDNLASIVLMKVI